MGKTGIFHHFGTFLIFAASILLLITTISAPVINDISLLKVTLTNQSSARNSSVTFGTFGHCVLDVAPASTDQDYCSGVHIGYNPADIMSEIDKTTFNTASTDTTKALTRVMVLHPVAAGLAFIAFLLALGAGICGALLSAFVSLLTLIVVVVVLACDFVLFGIIKNHINDRSEDASGSHASFGAGIWTLVAALIVLVLGTLVVLSTCLSSRMHKKRARASKSADAGYAAGGTTTKRKFWQRRAKY